VKQTKEIVLTVVPALRVAEIGDDDADGKASFRPEENPGL
jgi:hypothetical protein